LDALFEALPVGAAALVVGTVAWVWSQRVGYPFDLEWMEGGMLAHAWRVDHGLPIYGPPSIDFIPFVYPPGYTWLVAALSQVFGLSPELGRAVSIFSILAAAAALAWAARRAGTSSVTALAAAAVFLGTYPQSGAFYDIVRPDSLSLALLGWAIAIGAEDRKNAPVAAGLLLAGAFLVKQSAAVLGVPIALALALRDWRAAARFTIASVVPSLLMVGLLQWTSGGHFLTWLVAVPASHVLAWSRAWIETPREWGTALPLAFAACGLAFCWDATARQKAIPPWIAATVPVWAGIAFAWWRTYVPPPPTLPVFNLPSSLAYWAIGALPFALAIRLAGGLVDRLRGRGAPIGWRTAYGVGVLVTAGLMATLMRVHDGGYVNVHAPMFWCMSLAFALLVHQLGEHLAGRTGSLTRSALLTVQLLWALALVKPDRLVPTRADREMGWKFVDEAKKADGPVLSPFGAWLPVYAGKPPSLHAEGVWDVNYPGGPYRGELARLDEALRDHHWAMIIGGQWPFYGELTEHYRVEEELLPADDPRFVPKTGQPARPWRILVPKAGAAP
jgi:hypothetical protein